MLIESLTNIIKKYKIETEQFLVSDDYEIYNEPKEAYISGDNDSNMLNRLYIADNLTVLKDLIKTNIKIDLIYIDPPYNTKADYHSKIAVYPKNCVRNFPKIEKLAYTDYKKNGTADYLDAITERLFLMREVLSDKGSIYVHLDWHVVHYVKIILDEVFGKENFVNEIIWQRTGSQNNAASYGTNFDVILFYKKGDDKIWNNPTNEYSKEHLNSYFKTDKDGKYYRLNNPTGKGYQNHTRDFGAGPVFPPDGRHWSVSQNEIDRLLKENKIVFTSSGYPFIKKYLDDMSGKNVQSIWDDCIPPRKSSELTGYATQKPEKLLERIISASSDENSIVADFYGGSGTAAFVAKKLGRSWITCDFGSSAGAIAKKRMLSIFDNFQVYRPMHENELHTKALYNDQAVEIENDFIKANLKIVQQNKSDADQIKIILEKLTYKDKSCLSLNKVNTDKLFDILDDDPLATIDLWEINTGFGGLFKPQMIIKRDSEGKLPVESEFVCEKNKRIALKITDVFGLTLFHDWVIE